MKSPVIQPHCCTFSFHRSDSGIFLFSFSIFKLKILQELERRKHGDYWHIYKQYKVLKVNSILHVKDRIGYEVWTSLKLSLWFSFIIKPVYNWFWQREKKKKRVIVQWRWLSNGQRREKTVPSNLAQFSSGSAYPFCLKYAFFVTNEREKKKAFKKVFKYTSYHWNKTFLETPLSLHHKLFLLVPSYLSGMHSIVHLNQGHQFKRG